MILWSGIMTNCSKEYSQQLVEKYWQREWEKIKQIDFPKTREYDITLTECYNEVTNLLKKPKNNKSGSKTVVRFHPSMKFANRKGCLSPYDYWQLLKQDSELFKKFYENRLRCSDWFKEKNGKNLHYLEEGYVPEFIYGIGLSTSRKAPFVSYFKPALAKNLILKYLNEFNTIFDPCSGYSGRLIGTLCSGKNYIGYDINDLAIRESLELYNFLRRYLYNNATLQCMDSLHSTGNFDCMLTCTPYENIEEWIDSKGNKITSKMNCDDWIDKLTQNFKCKKYVFVTDGNIKKYKDNVVEELENTSHFGKNKEYVVVI